MGSQSTIRDSLAESTANHNGILDELFHDKNAPVKDAFCQVEYHNDTWPANTVFSSVNSSVQSADVADLPNSEEMITVASAQDDVELMVRFPSVAE